jgi:hypothetical protein
MPTHLSSADNVQEQKERLPTIHTLWVGSSLPVMARLTLTSYVLRGHPVVLHCYQEMEQVPKGVIVEDGRQTMPEKTLAPWLKTRQLATFADIFRYRLLQDGADIWSDLDVFCVKPLPKMDYLMAYENNRSISNAILALPSDSPMLSRLVTASSDPAFIPPWFSRGRTAKFRLMKTLGMDIARKMPWATFGPIGLTWYAKETGEVRHVVPMDMLYPVNGLQTRMLLDPGLVIGDLVTPRTRVIHLYNESFRRYNWRAIPDGSPIRQMLDAVGMTETSLWQTNTG